MTVEYIRESVRAGIVKNNDIQILQLLDRAVKVLGMMDDAVTRYAETVEKMMSLSEATPEEIEKIQPGALEALAKKSPFIESVKSANLMFLLFSLPNCDVNLCHDDKAKIVSKIIEFCDFHESKALQMESEIEFGKVVCDMKEELVDNFGVQEEIDPPPTESPAQRRMRGDFNPEELN